MKLLVVVGTRPEAIKLAPVIRELRNRGIGHTVVATGQHGSAVLGALEWFGVSPDVFLHGSCRCDLPSQLAQYVVQVTDCIQASHTHVIVQGDTTSALAGAMAGFYARLPVVHVEAGLRTGNMSEPWPEEMHRQAIARMTAIHCCPTEHEFRVIRGYESCPGRAYITGNTVIDALRWTIARVEPGESCDVIVTMHRRENWGRIDAVASALAESPYSVFWVTHPNQASRPSVPATDRLRYLPPMPYQEMVSAIMGCRVILTDSGGLQEEGPTLGKPVLVLRNVTERHEAVACGSARLVGVEGDAVLRSLFDVLMDDAAYGRMVVATNPYGDGAAARRIVEIIERHEAAALRCSMA